MAAASGDHVRSAESEVPLLTSQVFPGLRAVPASEMQKDDFDPIGITPPRGRQGHSVPTPRPLGLEPSQAGKGLPSAVNQPLFPVSLPNRSWQFECSCHLHLKKLDSWPTTDLQQSGSSSGSSPNAMSPAQFYAHRDHIFGGSLSKLDRMRSYQDSFTMEAFDETEEYDSTEHDGTMCNKFSCTLM